MKKSLLVAALITGFAGVAQAETSVTLYGVVDGGIGYNKIKGDILDGRVNVNAKNTGFESGVNSGNRWGLKGTEDLGEGLQAVFQLESGFDIGTGKQSQGSRLFGRQATIGLQSDAWGRLDFGRQTNITSKYLPGIVSPFGTDFRQAGVGAAFGAADSVRYDNMIMYQTPNYSGFQFGVGYSFNRDGNQQFKQSGQGEPNTRSWTTGLRYSNGPIAAAVTYDQSKAPESRGSVTVKSWNLGASYDFEIVKVHAGFGQARNGWLTSLEYGDVEILPSSSGYIVNDGMKVNSYTLGLSAPVGANGKVMASWAVADPKDSGQIADSWMDKQNVYSLGYSYALSKRTNVYALGSYAKNAAMIDGLKSTVIAAGLRHQF